MHHLKNDFALCMDDVFLIVKKHAITNFHNLLNSVHPHINFSIEQEQNGQLSFLDTIVTRNNAGLSSLTS